MECCVSTTRGKECTSVVVCLWPVVGGRWYIHCIQECVCIPSTVRVDYRCVLHMWGTCPCARVCMDICVCPSFVCEVRVCLNPTSDGRPRVVRTGEVEGWRQVRHRRDTGKPFPRSFPTPLLTPLPPTVHPVRKDRPRTRLPQTLCRLDPTVITVTLPVSHETTMFYPPRHQEGSNSKSWTSGLRGRRSRVRTRQETLPPGSGFVSSE